MDVRIEENVYIVSNIFSKDVGLQQRLADEAKREFTSCENSSRNLGCSKTSTSHTLVELKKKIVDNKMMNVTIEENVYIVSNIFFIDVGVQ